jgi:hypothetical protein
VAAGLRSSDIDSQLSLTGWLHPSGTTRRALAWITAAKLTMRALNDILRDEAVGQMITTTVERASPATGSARPTWASSRPARHGNKTQPNAPQTRQRFTPSPHPKPFRTPVSWSPSPPLNPMIDRRVDEGV